MRTSRMFVASVWAAAALACDLTAAQPQDKCKLIRIDEWIVRADRASPVVEGAINGRSILVLIDTGMTAKEGAMLERSLARRLGLPLYEDPSRRIVGVGGESNVELALLPEIKIGQAMRHQWWVMVGGEDHGQLGYFVIGNSFFRDIEVEFDLGRRAVRLFKSQDCGGASLAYWASSAGIVPVSTDGGITLDVLVNGKPIRALLDTGAEASIIDEGVLDRIGTASQLSTAAPGSCLLGAGKQRVDSQVGEFDSVAIGDEVIRNPKIYVADLHKNLTFSFLGLFRVKKHDLPEMVLGADFLRAHRVLVARTQGRMFLTYEGGPVFSAKPGASCLKNAVEPEQRQRRGEEGQ